MVCVTNRADDDGTGTHPGVREIAHFVQCHTDTVVVALAHLRIDGYLVRETAPHRSLADIYVVNVDRLIPNARGSEPRDEDTSADLPSRARRAALEPRTTAALEPRTTSTRQHVQRLTPRNFHLTTTPAAASSAELRPVIDSVSDATNTDARRSEHDPVQ